MTDAAALLRTPLHDRHVALGGRMVPFAGYEMPVQYRSIIEEHRAVRGAAGLFDLSHMGEIAVDGPEAVAFLRYALVSDPAALEPGQAQYSMVCDEDGGIVDDLIVLPHRSRLPGRLQRGEPRRRRPASHRAAGARRLRRHPRRSVRADRARRPAGPAGCRDPRPADRRRPRGAGQLPRRPRQGGRHRMPRGPHRLHRRGRLRAVLSTRGEPDACGTRCSRRAARAG